MSTSVTLTSAAVRGALDSLALEISITNTSPDVLGPGGSRLVAFNKSGQSVKLSAANLWPLDPGETLTVTLQVPLQFRSSRLALLQSIGYVEQSGGIYPLGSKVKFSGMLQTATVEDES